MRPRGKRAATRPSDLPDFKKPPIYELVLSIQFASTKLRNIDMGGIWQQFRKRYTTVEEQMPLTPQFEMYGLPLSQIESPRVIFSPAPTALRYWFLTSDGNELLQVQPDRLVHNWRQNSPGAAYPRYEPLRAQFLTEVRRIERYLTRKQLGSIKPNQCEVTYINRIALPGDVEPDDRLDQIFSVWHEDYSDDYLKRIERGQFAVTYVIPGDDSAPFGRLHVQAHTVVVRATSARIMQLTLTVRGKPERDTVESAFQWLDKGRSSVVRAFTSLTTKEMHQIWERTNG